MGVMAACRGYEGGRMNGSRKNGIVTERQENYMILIWVRWDETS